MLLQMFVFFFFVPVWDYANFEMPHKTENLITIDDEGGVYMLSVIQTRMIAKSIK